MYNIEISDGTTGGTFTIRAPLTVRVVSEPQRFAPTVNGGWVKTDIPYVGPTILELDCINIAIGQDEVNQLWDWFHNRTELTITDEAHVTGGPNAYYYEYTCYILSMPGDLMSPYKMKSESYTIVFAVKDATTI